MTTREEQKRLTRQRLIAVALEQFALRGITATRTVDVARSAGVAHGTVFAHFPTRDDLVTAVIEAFADQVIGRLNELNDRGAGVREVLAAHLEGLIEHEALYARLVMEGPILPSGARTTMLAIQSVVSHHLYAAAEKDWERAELRRMPQHLLFNTWLGLIHHYLVNQELFAPNESALARHGQELLEHYMGLLAP